MPTQSKTSRALAAGRSSKSSIALAELKQYRAAICNEIVYSIIGIAKTSVRSVLASHGSGCPKVVQNYLDSAITFIDLAESELRATVFNPRKK